MIERNGARLGLITTTGFRDVLELGTEQRCDIYDLFLQYPEPLVPRDLRLEIAGRIDRDGRVVEPLDAAAVRRHLQQMMDAGVESVAVCFINAYRNPTHERAVGTIARDEFPELVVSLSSEVVPELSEYHRYSTTCANAYVQPLMDRYLKRLERELHGRDFTGVLRLMHSAGGLLSPETGRTFQCACWNRVPQVAAWPPYSLEPRRGAATLFLSTWAARRRRPASSKTAASISRR
jgi:5-oxoprolinase (ATP-hydrolysing)/N-methylhydantoinase A